MLSDAKLFEIIAKWNFWDKEAIDSGFQRELTREAAAYLKGPEVIVFKGVRRSGKSTIMLQIMGELLSKGASPKDLLYINFEEPFFIEFREKNLLDRIFKVYREMVNPKRFPYIFLDEVQEVPSWEKWVRSVIDRKEAKVFVTGSSSKLLDSEFSTLLTGRNISFTVFPLSFKEFLSFKGLDAGPDAVKLARNKIQIKNLLLDYMRFGGFPEVVLKESPAMKEKLLKQYFEDILYRDIVWRYKIRDVATLKNIALLYMSGISALSSYNRIKNALESPLDVVRSYSGYLNDAYLIKDVMKHSFKLKEQLRNPKKIYSIDTGLRNAVSYRFSEDMGRIAENLVFLQIWRLDKEAFYYKNKHEVDFVTRRGALAESLIQVSMLEGGNEKALKRELDALEEGMASLGVSEGIIVTEDMEEEFSLKSGKARAVPLWKWLLL